MLRTALLFVRSAVRLVYAKLPGPVSVGRPTARRKGKVHREPQLSARKRISKQLHYSAVRTIQQATCNPAYSIPSYWSSLQGGEWLKRGGKARQQHRTPSASSEPVRIGPGFAGAALQRGALRLRPGCRLGPARLAGAVAQADGPAKGKACREWVSTAHPRQRC
jgi:hypothetical protein